ncbi:hypothetical protein SFRURICE_017983 [Spodoptera frugiperda]|nr:hypothetical protein SFRURICE_017983 [Spodoptera frugiperda]
MCMFSYTYTFYTSHNLGFLFINPNLESFLGFLHTTFCCIGFAMNFITVVRSKQSLKFLLMFQRVQRALNNKTDTKETIVYNWTTVIITLIYYFVYNGGLYYFAHLSIYYAIGCLCTISLIDFNMVYIIQIMKMLNNKMELWDIEVKHCEELEDRHGGHYWRKLFQTYVDILECYNIHNVCYQAFIAYYLIDVLIHSLVYIRIVILMLHDDGDNISNISIIISIFLSTWVFKNFHWQAKLIHQYEKFYIAEKLNIIDVMLFNVLFYFTGAEKKLCKNMLRLHRASFSKMSLYGMFHVDAALQQGLTMLLTEYTVSMLLPLNMLQYLMCCPKYRIKYDFIIPNNFMTDFVSLIANIVFIAAFTYTLYGSNFYGPKHTEGNNFLFFMTVYDSIFYSLGFVLDFVIGIVQSKQSIRIVLIFQKVHRFLNNKINTKQTVIWNWVVVLLEIICNLIYHTVFSICTYIPIEFTISNATVTFLDFNIICTIQVIKMLKNKVDLWNIQAKYGGDLEDRHGGQYWKKLFQTYVDILECYDLHNKCYRAFILYYTSEVLVHTLVYIEMSIHIVFYLLEEEYNQGLFIILMLLFAWLLKNFTLLTILIHQYEMFYIAVQNVQDTCSFILMTTKCDDEKRLCKNILRLHRASFSKMSLYGMFHVDAALHQGLMLLLTEYTAVLLSFALLLFSGFNFQSRYSQTNTLLEYLCIYDAAFYGVGFMLNFVIEVVYSKISIQFVLIFQNVHRFLNNSIDTKQIIISNWIIVLLISMFYPIFFTSFCIVTNFSFSLVIASHFLAAFDFNMIYAIQVMKMLTNKVELWNIQVKHCEELEDRHGGHYWRKLFQTYVDILECYDMHKICYQAFIMFYIVENFNHFLIYVQESITVLQEGFKFADDTYVKFYRVVQNVQDTCTLILKKTCSDAEKRLCKNMLRLHRASFSKMSLYGMFHVDAALQQGLTMLLTEYTVVLLQFAIFVFMMNWVQEDVQSMFLPLNVLHHFMFWPRYRIKNNFIFHNKVITNCFSFFMCLVCMLSYAYHFYHFHNFNYFLIEIVDLTTFIVFLHIAFCSTGFILNFDFGSVRGKNSIKLILKFQEVHRFLYTDTSTKQTIYFNWIYVIFAISLTPLYFIAFHSCAYLSSYYIFSSLPLAFFDFNIVYTIQTMMMLTNKVELWNIEIKSTEELEVRRGGRYWRKLFQTYVDILECYNFNNFCYQPLVSKNDCFIRYLDQILPDLTRLIALYNGGETVAIFVALWMTKRFYWQTKLVHWFEKFYTAVQDAEKRLCKNILRLHRASFSKMSLYGMFHVDAALQLIDREVQAILRPLNLMQHITFGPKYRIKNNYIFPNNLLTNVLSLAAKIVFIFSYTYCVYFGSTYAERISQPITFLDFLRFYDCLFYCIGFALTFVIQVTQGKNSILFVLLFQEVHRFLNNKISIKQTVSSIWIVVILTSLFVPVYFIVFCVLVNFPFYFIIPSHFLAAFDFNMVYATQVMKLLTNKVDLWVSQVKYGDKLESRHRGDYWRKLFQTYVDIMKCYDIHNNCYRAFDDSIFAVVLVLLWLLKNFVLLTKLIHQYDKFYITVQHAQDTCTLILKTTNSDAEKRLCKNVLRLHRASFSKMSLYGMFHVDAALQQGLTMLLTEYTVVLLQFTFL